MVTGQGAALRESEPVIIRNQPTTLVFQMQMRPEVVNDRVVLALTREVCDATNGILRVLARDPDLRTHKVSLLSWSSFTLR